MWNMETHCFPGNCLVCPFHGSRLAGSIELLDPADPCPVTDKGATACERSESRMPCCPERFRFSDGCGAPPRHHRAPRSPPFSSRSRILDPMRNLDSRRPELPLASSRKRRCIIAPQQAKMGADFWSFEGCGPAASATNHTATSHAWCLARLKPRGGPKVQSS